jgi:hypothetical protein
MDTRLNEEFQAAVEAKKVPGVAAVALDKTGNVLYKGVFGTTNIDDPDGELYYMICCNSGQDLNFC